MAVYRISGIWKDDQGVITHYAFHKKTDTGWTRAEKLSKPEAVRRLNISGNIAYTWLWNYSYCWWEDGEEVEVVNNEFLRSNPDKKETNNLAHLIDYDWVFK